MAPVLQSAKKLPKTEISRQKLVKISVLYCLIFTKKKRSKFWKKSKIRPRYDKKEERMKRKEKMTREIKVQIEKKRKVHIEKGK